MPGVPETTAALHRAGKLLAVCSNKPVAFTRELLDHFRLLPLLGAVLGPEDVACPKPAPDMLVTALARLQVPPEEALYVGDMVVDIETGRAAGVRVWVVPTGSDDQATLVAARPDRVLEGLADLSVLLGCGPA
jgi:HAD superfamily hydrolase (TIGR01509 family)